MSLFHPPAWLPPQLAFLWPLIWVQVLMLRAQIRAAYGRGVKYHWALTPNLRVYLYSIDWIPGQAARREGLKPRPHFNDRLAAACDGRAAAPAYSVQFGECHDASATPAASCFAMPGALNLPLPET
ncbi:hypothetical protein [uncultured Hyphomonas sp.]|uniref:hypothetical protein n=1 Tax=uncultured Hyphomonas sp. TaxID=225298 RepID=UPI002AAA72BE|nr:hypothetical protein [uncultured Hyphomonas sp.]